jgi:hypothetical protein
LLNRPPHHLRRQLITRLAKPDHHRWHLHIAQRLTHFKAATGENPLVITTHQQRIETHNDTRRCALVFSLERLQAPAQFQVRLEIAVVGAQQRNPTVTLKTIQQTITQQHRRRVAPA